VPINFERLDAAITYAAEHPAEFDMDSWFAHTDCGTTACLAGTVALQAGWKPVFYGDGFTTTSIVKLGERTSFASAVSNEILGLDDVEHGHIYGADDLADVIRIRNAWAVEAGVPERTWSLS
jgi:hypothetical protein